MDNQNGFFYLGVIWSYGYFSFYFFYYGGLCQDWDGLKFGEFLGWWKVRKKIKDFQKGLIFFYYCFQKVQIKLVFIYFEESEIKGRFEIFFLFFVSGLGGRFLRFQLRFQDILGIFKF